MGRKKSQTKIMVFGTFDGLHPGHLNFLKQAKKSVKKPLKSFLTVSIARDKNVFRIKGAHPRRNEQDRMSLLKKCGLADKVILSGIKNYLPHIIKERPDIIALGYDQKAYVKNLKTDLKKKNLKVKIIRLKPYMAKIYKNKLLKNN